MINDKNKDEDKFIKYQFLTQLKDELESSPNELKGWIELIFGKKSKQYRDKKKNNKTNFYQTKTYNTPSIEEQKQIFNSINLKQDESEIKEMIKVLQSLKTKNISKESGNENKEKEEEIEGKIKGKLDSIQDGLSFLKYNQYGNFPIQIFNTEINDIYEKKELALTIFRYNQTIFENEHKSFNNLPSGMCFESKTSDKINEYYYSILSKKKEKFNRNFEKNLKHYYEDFLGKIKCDSVSEQLVNYNRWN